jgi:hypothetical protein
MMQSVDDMLRADGPALSSALVQKLVAGGLTPEAARQRVSRGGKGVRRLSGLIFPKNARFLYHDDDYLRERYWRHLLRDISTASPAYGPAIGALLARGGIVPREHFEIVSGSPIRQKGQVASSTVLERLLAVNFLEMRDVEGIGPCVAIAAAGHFGAPDVDGLRARLITEGVLLAAVRDWARRLGMASYDKIDIRDRGTLPRCGTFNWDLCGPSYLRPLIGRDKAKKTIPGFLVCDAVSGGAVDELAIAAFLRKCQLSASLRNMPTFLPVLIADRYTREALRLGKAYGVMMATPQTLLGREIASGLAALLATLTKAAAVAVQKPEVIGELFSKLSSIEGAGTNLRGALFEMIVGNLTQAVEGGSIDIGRRVNFASGDIVFKAELDVLRVTGNRVTIYECKGYQPAQVISAEDVQKWLKEKVPGINTWTKTSQFANHQISFEYWTTGQLAADARELLETAAAATKKYAISYKEGPAVRKYAAELAGSGILKVLDEHYFNHPIARFDRRYDAPTRLEELEIDLDLGADLNGVGSDDEVLPV